MSYQTYITEAIVCGSWHSNTADKSILLFSREAGMVYAQAKSVREERSKQRFALQDASHVRVTLIRGKSGWKIAGAEALRNFYTDCADRESRALVRDVILLLKRVLRGEGSHHHMFDDVVAVLTHAAPPHDVARTILSLRILHALGYVGSDAVYAPFLGVEFPFAALATMTPALRTQCEIAIEHGLLQSQL